MTPDEHKIPDVFNFVQILLDLSKNRHYIKKLPIRNIRPFHFLLFYNQPLHILLFYNHPSQFVHRFSKSHDLACKTGFLEALIQGPDFAVLIGISVSNSV